MVHWWPRSRKDYNHVIYLPNLFEQNRLTFTSYRSLVVDHLQSQLTPPDIGMAYFYCDYRDQYGSTQSNILGSLLQQFAAQLAEIPTCLIELYEKHKTEGSLPLASEMSGALRQICLNFEKSFVFIDAFDEIVAPIE